MEFTYENVVDRYRQLLAKGFSEREAIEFICDLTGKTISDVTKLVNDHNDMIANQSTSRESSDPDGLNHFENDQVELDHRNFFQQVYHAEIKDNVGHALNPIFWGKNRIIALVVLILMLLGALSDFNEDTFGIVVMSVIFYLGMAFLGPFVIAHQNARQQQALAQWNAMSPREQAAVMERRQDADRNAEIQRLQARLRTVKLNAGIARGKGNLHDAGSLEGLAAEIESKLRQLGA